MEKKIENKNIDIKGDGVEEERLALLNILEDVEEARKQAEEERDKTRVIITNFTDGLLVFDENKVLFLINPYAEKLLDIKAEEITGKFISELIKFPKVGPLINLFEKEDKGIFRKELSIKDDLVLEVTTVLMIREKKKTGTLVILHDITREKAVEAMKSEFVSLSAHQLRTPLSAIKWALKTLIDGDFGEMTKEQRDFIEKSYKANERMIFLINGLLDVTRIEEGRYLYNPIFADIEEICRSVVDSYTETAKKKNIRIEFKKSGKRLPKAKVDVEKIKIAINNLLDNSLRYTLSGGQVIISLEYTKKEIRVSVEDTGVGILEDQQKRIFTKFFRGTNVLRLDTEGSGIGLFIVKNIIEAHGGKIWFKSKENKGSAFYFTLPLENVINK